MASPVEGALHTMYQQASTEPLAFMHDIVLVLATSIVHQVVLQTTCMNERPTLHSLTITGDVYKFHPEVLN